MGVFLDRVLTQKSYAFSPSCFKQYSLNVHCIVSNIDDFEQLGGEEDPSSEENEENSAAKDEDSCEVESTACGPSTSRRKKRNRRKKKGKEASKTQTAKAAVGEEEVNLSS